MSLSELCIQRICQMPLALKKKVLCCLLPKSCVNYFRYSSLLHVLFSRIHPNASRVKLWELQTNYILIIVHVESSASFVSINEQQIQCAIEKQSEYEFLMAPLSLYKYIILWMSNICQVIHMFTICTCDYDCVRRN